MERTQPNRGLSSDAQAERHFGDTGDSRIDPLSDAKGPGYHTRFDRGDIIGANNWNRAPANGAIAIGDVFAVAAQFGASRR